MGKRSSRKGVKRAYFRNVSAKARAMGSIRNDKKRSLAGTGKVRRGTRAGQLYVDFREK